MEETPEALSVEYRQRSWVDLPWLPATPPCSRRSCCRCHDHFIERDAVLAPIVEPVRVEAWAAPSDRGTCCPSRGVAPREPPLRVEDVADVQVAGRGDAGEGEDHDADQGAIPQPNHVSPTFGAQQVAEPGARMAVRQHAD